MQFLGHILIDTIEDTVKLIPFLFITYLGMEYLENRAGEKTVSLLLRAGKKGPIAGGILGAIPQCGFSAVAANLYAGGVITVGTMIAVFLSTSDEMLPILISKNAGIKEVLFIIGAKALVGIVAGLLIDYLIRRLHRCRQKGLQIHEICENENCHCKGDGILRPALVHCANITVFIFVILLVINFLAEWMGMEQLIRIAGAHPIGSVFLIGLIGLIPNCAVSVAITTFYLEGVLSFGSMFAGLLACAGVGIVILLRMNRSWKNNLMIIGGIYAISVSCGILIQVLI